MRSVSLFLLLAAVAATPAAARDKGLGLVVQNNVAAMLVDPNPVWANVKIEGGDGTRADGALYRYRSGQVTPLMPLSGKSTIGAAGVGASQNAVTRGGEKSGGEQR
jgi:type IV pilus biogenesis protein CpaD/CtpE